MNTPAPHALRGLNTFGVEAWTQQLEVLSGSSQAYALWQRHGTPDLLLGGGSNVLLVRRQFGQVWLNRIHERQVLHRGNDQVRVRLGAGENWDQTVAWCLQQQAYGLENLSLIPGLCGAAPIQNIGAYGVEIAAFIHCVEALDLHCGAIQRLSAAQCDFAYRHSLFRTAPGARWLILAVELDLHARPRPVLDYPGIRETLAQWQADTTDPQQIRRAVIHIRRSKLPDPVQLGNAGSFFKNPLVSPAATADLLARYPALPHWPQPGGQVKLSAAWLIDQCGFKGCRQGDAGVHNQHALVLVNHGKASGDELLALARHIQQRVREQFGIMLEAEPRIVH